MRIELTEQEKALPLMDWDDAELGKAVKAASVVLAERPEGEIEDQRLVQAKAAALWLVQLAVDMGAKRAGVEIEGVTAYGTPMGDWIVTVERTAPPATF